MRLTLPGYNNFSRSLPVITPEKFGRGAAFIVVVEGGAGMDIFDERLEGNAFGSRGEVCSDVDNTSN